MNTKAMMALVGILAGCGGTDPSMDAIYARRMVGGNILTPPDWIAPTLQGYWLSYGNLAYSKDLLGWVTFRGAANGSGPGASGVIFTLPAGFRPGSDSYFPVATSLGGTNWITVSASTGNVSFASGSSVPSGCWITLSAARFLAEN